MTLFELRQLIESKVTVLDVIVFYISAAFLGAALRAWVKSRVFKKWWGTG